MQTPNSQTENIKTVLFALFFCVLSVYGLSAVVYFSLEFISPTVSDISKGIFYSNLSNGLGALVAVYVFINFFEAKIRTNAFKYLSLAAITAFFIGIAGLLIGLFYWRYIAKNQQSEARIIDSFLYSVIPLLVSCAYFFYWQQNRNMTRKITEQEYQLLHLEKLTSKAQLDALEARINPHFLYNSLNSIAGLIHEQPDQAEEMTIQLSKLFRYTTGRNSDNFHSIADELEIVKAYLSIEKVRFGERLSYTINCESDVLNCNIPRFLLQPLVENAIKHGISKISHAGIIKVKIEQIERNIQIKIHDNGPAFDEAVGGGFGLRSIKEKLNIVYGQKATIDIQNEPEKAVVISLVP